MAWRKMGWAYVSGFFDGEGCINCQEGFQSNGVPFRRWRLHIYQNDRSVLDEIQSFLAKNRIKSTVRVHSRPDRISMGHAGSFFLEIQGASNTYRTLLKMEGHLRVKHEQAVDVISRMEELMEMAERGELASPRATHTYGELRKVVG